RDWSSDVCSSDLAWLGITRPPLVGFLFNLRDGIRAVPLRWWSARVIPVDGELQRIRSMDAVVVTDAKQASVVCCRIRRDVPVNLDEQHNPLRQIILVVKLAQVIPNLQHVRNK